MKVSQIMNRNVSCCRPHDTLDSAAGSLWDRDIGCLIVVGEDGQVEGVITDRDICMAAYTQGLSLRELKVASAMSKQLYTCSETDSLLAAEEKMRDHKVRRLPVVDKENQLVGVLSLNDLAIEAERQRDKKARELSEVEVAATLAAVCEHRKDGSLEQVY